MNLGENIYKLRIEKNLSQGGLADALEVSRQSVSKWENNSAVPELDKLVKMAEIFGVTLDELVRNTPDETTSSTESVPASPSGSPVITGITTGELVSVILLLFAVIVPLLLLVTAELHNHFWLLIVGLFLPMLATIGAMKCAPKNKLLYKLYLVFDIIMAVIVCAAFSGAVWLGLVLGILYLIPIGIWSGFFD